MSHRIEKVNDLVRNNLALIINKETSFKKGVFVSIIKVDTSKDLRYANVFVSVYPAQDRDYAMKTLQKELYKIQRLLNKSLSMKILPRISFRADTVQENVEKLEDIFEQISKEKAENGTSEEANEN